MKRNNGKNFFWMGIDCGKDTGIAIWDATNQEFQIAYTTDFWGAIENLQAIPVTSPKEADRGDVVVAVEDPSKINTMYDRHRNKKRKVLANIAQKVGRVKRETELLVEFLHRNDFLFQTIRPTRQKLDQESFENRTNYDGATNQHERDAAMLVYGRAPMTGPKLELLKHKRL